MSNLIFIQSVLFDSMRNNKIILLIFIVVLSNTSIFSQGASDSCKFEIGVGVPHFPGTFCRRTPAPVISFKAIQEKNALRAGLIYDLTAPIPLKDYAYLLVNLGYERRLFRKKSKLLLGVDVCYLNRFLTNSSPSVTSKFYHIGIGPVIGYLYEFSNRVSFQTEVGLYYGYGETKYYDNGIFKNSNKGGVNTGHRFFSLNLFYRLK